MHIIQYCHLSGRARCSSRSNISMTRKPFFEALMQEIGGSVTTLVAVAVGALVLYVTYHRQRSTSRPPPPRRSLADRSSTAYPSIVKDVKNAEPLAKLIAGHFIGTKICIEKEVVISNSAWKENPQAKNIVSYLAFCSDLYVMCQIASEQERQNILLLLKGIDGLQRHKILFCERLQSYDAITRQINPSLFITGRSTQLSFLSKVLPYILYVGPDKIEKSNVSCIKSINLLPTSLQDDSI